MSKAIRDQIRAQVFSGENKPKARIVEFFGANIELRQPTLHQVLTAQRDEDREAAVINMLVENAFVPAEEGQAPTNERVFEDTDADALKGLPFDSNFLRVSSFFDEVTDVSFRDRANAAKEKSGASAGDEAGLGAEEA